MTRVRHLVHTAYELKQIGEPERRAAVERWLLEFAAVNVQLNITQAMVAGGQLARRYGHWAIVDEHNWDRLCRVPLRTELEWSLDGLFPADFARPVTVPGSHGEEVELFLPEDVPGASLGERIEPVEHRQVGYPEFPVPDFAEFADYVGERERAMFGKIVEANGLVRWEPDLPGEIDHDLDLDDPEETELYGGEIYFHLNLSPFFMRRGVMDRVLQMVTELNVLYLTGALEDPEDDDLDVTQRASPLELELAAWLAARRLRQEVMPGPAAATWLSCPWLPAPERLRWALVFDAAGAVEGTMLGHRYKVND
jgi:hypothetical protein